MTGTIATTIVLVVSPWLNADGRKAYSTRGQLFDGKVDGRFVVKRSPTPFCAAARVLLAEGLDPATKLVMRHEGSTHDALRSTVGAAAKITVADSSTGKPVFVPWVDLRETYGSTARSGPPMRETESPAVSGTRDARTRTGGRPMTRSSILTWRQVYGDRAAQAIRSGRMRRSMHDAEGRGALPSAAARDRGRDNPPYAGQQVAVVGIPRARIE